MDENRNPLDDLLARLDAFATRSTPKDAIDGVLSTPTRQTDVRSLRDHAAVIRFRQELSDGMIRVDTANRLLRLVAQAMEVNVV